MNCLVNLVEIILGIILGIIVMFILLFSSMSLLIIYEKYILNLY